AHQDRVDIAAGLQPEQRPPVVDEVEFDVAPPPFELARPLRLPERHAHAAADELRKDGQEGLADVAGEGEVPAEIAFEMVVEDAADAAVHVAMGNEEIVVRPFAESL